MCGLVGSQHEKQSHPESEADHKQEQTVPKLALSFFIKYMECRVWMDTSVWLSVSLPAAVTAGWLGRRVGGWVGGWVARTHISCCYVTVLVIIRVSCVRVGTGLCIRVDPAEFTSSMCRRTTMIMSSRCVRTAHGLLMRLSAAAGLVVCALMPLKC